MISNEMLDDLIEISKKGKYLYKWYIDKLCMYLIEESDPITKSRFKDLYFVDNIFGGLDCDASCLKHEGIIEYCYDAAVMHGARIRNLSILQTNLYMVIGLVHEIEHMKEYYKVTQNNFDSLLIQNSDNEFLRKLIEYKYLPKFIINHKYPNFIDDYIGKKSDDFYLKMWDIVPLEKIAEADALKLIYDSLNNYPNFKDKYKEEYTYILKECYNSLILGYKRDKKNRKLLFPLASYIDKIKKIDKYGIFDPAIEEEFKNCDKYNIYEKMKYGFPIEEQELEEVKKKMLTRSTI